jgi:hypothetical protein
MSMIYLLKYSLVCQQSHSERLYLFSVPFRPGEGTTCVPLLELVLSYVGTSLVHGKNYFRWVYHGGTENHSSPKKIN